MQDEDNRHIVLNEIESRVNEKLESIFKEILSENIPQFENLEGIIELMSWYKKSGKQGNILEKILEDIVNETMKYLPQQYVSLSVENIKINSKEKRPNVKFNVPFQIEPIKPYVEFIISINKINKKTGRIVFEINAGGNVSDVTVFSDKEKISRISLGITSGMIQVSIIEVPFMKIDKPIEIGSKEIEIDMSKYSVRTNNT